MGLEMCALEKTGKKEERMLVKAFWSNVYSVS